MNIEEALKTEHSYLAGEYDVAVVGAGHAGCEAAHACAAMGLKTILFTLHLDSLANLPCNPSIGGTAKGQIVREVDALGGIMGKVADDCLIQMRMLNRTKGPAVHSPRAQMDRSKYSVTMKNLLEHTDNLDLRQGHVTALLAADEGNGVYKTEGVMTESKAVYKAKAVVICSGTYMESRTIRGEVIVESGPDGLPRSVGLSKSLEGYGIPLLRFKTGTPVRVNAGSVDFSSMQLQEGEHDVPLFSFENEMNGRTVPDKQTPCYSVWTSPQTREVIFENMDRSPLYSGVIKGTGPRYCPSIEDKFVKFEDKTRHQIFIEPMGENTSEMYLQGFSTSLPEDVQVKMVHSLPGLENAVIQRSAYAIEYDLIEPTTLKQTLQSKLVEGLFTAGQINGSSGYEEAAGQGLIAGINAGRYVKGEKEVIIDRSQGYIGVLVDDLVTKGTNEPYRMMTSRAEYRLFLRYDNADLRLTPIGREVGLISDERYEAFENKYKEIRAERERLESTFVGPTDALKTILEEAGSVLPPSGVSIADLIKRPNVTYDMLAPIDSGRPQLSRDIRKEVETDIKYDGYLKLEREKIDRFVKLEKKTIPEDTDYTKITGLRLEARQKLMNIKPLSLGQASRISGVSPADISVLLVYLEATKGGTDV
ncbi:MAG: tRNA uridine-5-carboxymethylaminomethyl(34) synthesis enzyme MnmG [Clostridiales bacterium]|nr:tRNA uridine-5-carboxymethylaminomethyl(34) synthesis enzyme MnmG [Clostridiales bacterium]